MIGNFAGVLSRLTSYAATKTTTFRKFLATGQGIYWLFLWILFVILIAAGIAVLGFIHPADNFSDSFYEQWPRLQWFLIFLVTSGALFYGLTEMSRVNNFAKSRIKHAVNFFTFSFIRLLILLMIITCFYLLFVREAFSDEEILRVDLLKHYVFILCDAVTFDLMGQWLDIITNKYDLTALGYAENGFYGGWVRLFKVAYIVMLTWTWHKAITFKTHEERMAEHEAYWEERIKEKNQRSAQ